MGKHPSSTLVSFDIIDPAPKIKRLMALEDGVKVYCFTRVRNVDNEPLILETSYYPQHIYPNLTREMPVFIISQIARVSHSAGILVLPSASA